MSAITAWARLCGEARTRLVHRIREYPKRAWCFIIGHKVELTDPDYYDGSQEGYCERCCDEGDFDSFERIPTTVAWELQERVVWPLLRFWHYRILRKPEPE